MGILFTRAAPQQASLKAGFYGPPGSGKSFTSLLLAEGLARRHEPSELLRTTPQGARLLLDGRLGSLISFEPDGFANVMLDDGSTIRQVNPEDLRVAHRTLVVDTERGTDFYSQRVPTRQVHPEAFDFDAIYTKSMAKCAEAVTAAIKVGYSVVIIDSITHIWQAAIEAYESGGGSMTSIDTIPMTAWGRIKKPYKRMLRDLLDANVHFVICGRQKNVFDENEEGRIQKVGVAMKAEGETPYEPHITARFEAEIDPRDTTVSRYRMYVEKDRTGVLSGRTLVNPNFATFEPIIPLLGTVQGQSEDEEEVAAADGDLLKAEKEKQDKKGEKSALIFDEMKVALAGVTKIEGLGEWATTLKKQRRYLTEDHLNAARVLYGRKREELMGKAAPEEV